jgi:aspartate racemase
MSVRFLLPSAAAAGVLVVLAFTPCTGQTAGDVVPPGESGRGPRAPSSLKTIGVLGGLGPQATMDFEQRLHRAAQRVIPPHLNGGYPPTVVWYCRHPPILVKDDGRPLLPLRPDPRLLEAAGRLGQVADFLVIPSNTPHALQPEIERAAGKSVVSMVGATVDEVRRRGWKRVGVVALGEPVFYTGPLGRLGVSCETLDQAARDALDPAIFRVMEGREGAEDRAAAKAAVQQLRARKVDGSILGCTEVPLLLGKGADEDPDLLNPAELLAAAAVAAAMESR